MRRNYIVIDNREYDIFHTSADGRNNRLGGIGYGGGSGLGLKFELGESILADIYYKLYYGQTNFRENYQPFNVHHSLGIRIIWGKNN